MKIDYNDNVIKTMSLADLESSILGYKKMFCKDGITANDIPVFVIDGCRDLYPLVIYDEKNLFDVKNTILIRRVDNKIELSAKDVRPECEGDYFEPRKNTSEELTGIVKSKKAAERIMRFVAYVLDTDVLITRMLVYDPFNVKIVFSAIEFDLELLLKNVQAKNNVITEEIIKLCKKQ